MGSTGVRAAEFAQRLAGRRQNGPDAASDLAFETYAGLVRRLLGVPAALVGVVRRDR